MNLFWHRRDLRLRDNRGLALAASDDDVLPVFVFDDGLLRQIGERQRAFLFAGVDALREEYRERGSDLVVRRGEPPRALAAVREAVDAGARGPVIGRSVWQSDDPAAVTRALGEIVREGASVDEAWLR